MASSSGLLFSFVHLAYLFVPADRELGDKLLRVATIPHGADINDVDHTGQTTLHWSDVRGHIEVAELLLKEGAKVDAAHLYGYQATHVAAQYGQTAFICHIVAKCNADPDVPDNDGRSPLHWAAYKGFADSIRLLLFLDAYRGRQDKEGCTPLHWAAIRGNLEACTTDDSASRQSPTSVYMVSCHLYGLQNCNTSTFSCGFCLLDPPVSLFLTQVLALAYYTISYFAIHVFVCMANHPLNRDDDPKTPLLSSRLFLFLSRRWVLDIDYRVKKGVWCLCLNVVCVFILCKEIC